MHIYVYKKKYIYTSFYKHSLKNDKKIPLPKQNSLPTSSSPLFRFFSKKRNCENPRPLISKFSTKQRIQEKQNQIKNSSYKTPNKNFGHKPNNKHFVTINTPNKNWVTNLIKASSQTQIEVP